jgi:hypothetical protein
MPNLFTLEREGTPINSATQITLPKNGDTFEIYGNLAISKIVPNGRGNGARAILRFHGRATLTSETAPIWLGEDGPMNVETADVNTLYLANGRDAYPNALDAICLEYREWLDGEGQWVELWRTEGLSSFDEETTLVNHKLKITYDTDFSPAPLVIQVGKTILGAGGSFTITPGDSAGTVKAAAAAVAAIGAVGNILVTYSLVGTEGSYLFEFAGDLAGQFISRFRPATFTSGWDEDISAYVPGGKKVNIVTPRDGVALRPSVFADTDAPNNSIYYSTTASKLVYKNSAGVVNALY